MPVKPKDRLAIGQVRTSGRRAVTAIALVLWATACAPVDKADFWDSLPTTDAQGRADGAIAALARGDYVDAESKVDSALRADPRNPYALLAAGALYQETGRTARARQAYQEVLSLSESVPVNGDLWGASDAATAQGVARDRLAALDGAMPERMPGDGVPRMDDGMADSATMPIGVVPAVRVDGPALGDGEGLAPGLDGRLWPEAQRFRILRDLRDAGLITPQEYARRRAANLGALLPLSQPAPAVGLDRPVAHSGAIADRLKQLRIAYEDRYISAAQHAAERDVILDSLLPANPRDHAPEAHPPETVVEAAAAVGRLERLHELGLISTAEMRAERARLDKVIADLSPSSRPKAPPKPKAEAPAPAPKPKAPAGGGGEGGAASGGMTRELGSDAQALSTQVARPTLLLPEGGAANPAAVLRSGRAPLDVVPYQASGETTGKPAADAPPQDAAGDSDSAGDARDAPIVAVHLASFRSEERARVGWRELSGRYDALKGLSPRIVRVTLPGKGVFYRLHAAPLPDMAAAEALCGRLGSQYCDPTSLN